MSNRRSRNNRRIKNTKFHFNFDFDFNFNKFLIIPISILAILIIFSVIFSIINMGNNKILNNIYVRGIDVSNLTKEEAKDKLESSFKSNIESSVLLNFEDYSLSLLPSEINFEYNISSAIDDAYLIGRSGNIFSNNFTIISSIFDKHNIELDYTYDEEKLEKIITNISSEIPGVVTKPSFYINDENTLIITKGQSGNKLDMNSSKTMILSAIDTDSNIVSLKVDKVEPDDINIDEIYKEVYRKPQNASITTSPYSVTVEENGIDFAISLEDAKNLISSQDLEQYSIPLKVTEPEIKVADLGEDIFKNTLSSFTTKYDITNINRSTNVELAISKINGTILQPGETFSFNTTVGARTTQNGFKNAAIYSDGELEYGIGGGICQVSSTLYNSVLRANLDIVERKNHSMTVNYVDVGMDATVSYGSVDFKFKNSRTYPIKVVATAKSGVMTISICGVPENVEYDVSFASDVLQKVDYKITYEPTSTLLPGAEYIKQSGKYGYKVSTYKILSQNGKEVSRVLLSTDTYKPQERIIQKGR